MSRKLNLLLITRPFIPLVASGALRAWYIAKYLSKRDWKVTVISAGHPSEQVLQDPAGRKLVPNLKALGIRWFWVGKWRGRSSGMLKHYLSSFYDKFNPFAIRKETGWFIRLLLNSWKFRIGKHDIIMATGSPFSSFIAAFLWSKIYKVPFIVDYRDPWTFNPHNSTSFTVYRFIERNIVPQSSFVTTVSDSLSTALTMYLNLSGRVYTITNGYDPDDAKEIVSEKFSRPAIVYAGIFYPPKRVIAPVFNGMKLAMEMLTEKEYPEFHYFGPDERHIINEAGKAGIRELVFCHGIVPRKKVFQAIKGAVLAPVITSVFPKGDLVDRGIVTGKIFEILNLKVPILLIAPHRSDARKILEESNAGEAFVGTDIKGIADFIVRACKGELHLSFSGREKYSWPNIIQKLDGLLREAIKNVGN